LAAVSIEFITFGISLGIIEYWK